MIEVERIVPEIRADTLDGVAIDDEDLGHVVSQHFARVADVHRRL